MIIALTIGSLVLALTILIIMILRKNSTPKGDVDAKRVLNELKNSMKVFEFPKENAHEEDIIDSTVDIFDNKPEVKEEFKEKKTKNANYKKKKTSSKKTKK